jgi:hypothetical protein
MDPRPIARLLQRLRFSAALFPLFFSFPPPSHATPPLSQDAAWLFERAVLPVFELTVDGRDWEWLQANARQEKAVPASLRIDGEPVGRVGVRYKGSYGSLYFCLGEDGRPKCKRMSLKIEIDHVEKDRRYLGLKTLNLHGSRGDDPGMRERLAYEVFRAMGIPTSRTNHARVVVNGRPMGIYLLVEQVDREFLKDRFRDPGGPLYKEAWPVSSDPTYYSAKEKDGPGKKADREDPVRHQAFLDFHAALASSDGKGPETRLSRFLDPDAMMRYLAADFATRNYDGIMAFYCGGDGKTCGNHNYYWYREPASGLFHLIPWDLNWTFQLNSTFNFVPGWKTEKPDCDKRYPSAEGKTTVRTPACDALFREWAACDRARYRKALQEVLEGPLKEGRAEAMLEGWAAVLGDASVAEGGLGRERIQGDVHRLRQDLQAIRNLVKEEREGWDVTPFRLAAGGVNGFEDFTPNQALGIEVMGNNGTTLSHGPNRKDPISGKRDFRLDFAFRNESEGPEGAWKQWGMAGFQVGAEGLGENLSGKWKLRLKAKSDRVRSLRVSMDSPKYVEDNWMNGITYGWETRVGSEVTILELAMETAAYPSWAKVRPDVPLASVLETVSGIRFSPAAEGRDSRGLLPPGGKDEGFLQVDDIEFVGP